MNQGKYIFVQLTEFLPQWVFDRIVENHQGCSNTVDKTTGVLYAQIGRLETSCIRKEYPEKLRRIKY